MMEPKNCFEALRFVADSSWSVACWSATTFRWHPRSVCPPLMGLVFDNAEAGQGIFGDWIAEHGNADPTGLVRVAVIEGGVELAPPCYVVHLSTNIASIFGRSEMDGIAESGMLLPRFSRINRMHAEGSFPSMLACFKEEFARHGEYLLAPVIRKTDGQLWFDIERGIVKDAINFRKIDEIADDDPDAVVKLLCSSSPEPPY